MDVRVAIIGSGFGGLGAAIRLKQAGVEDLVVLERAAEIGGTWRDNAYPGIACDVPSHLYSFSFAPNPDWSRRFSPGAEIQEYLRRCAREHGVLPHVRLGHEVLGAAWDDAAQRWRVETTRGAFTAAVLVAAPGFLSDPVLPDVPGLDAFEGTAFHSARWPRDVDLAGRRVAVVGTGASAAQIVPAIQPAVAALHLFQRTPAWVMPRLDRAIGPRRRAVYRRVPAAQRAVRALVWGARELLVPAFRRAWVMRRLAALARAHLALAVRDPALRARLTPDYALGCKRVVLSDDFLPALTRPNVEVVAGGLAEVRVRSAVGADGVERPVDVIVFATGFRPTRPPIADRVRGRGGRLLADAWGGSPVAYAGTTVAGFPNLFILLGPNTGLGHSSVVLMIEAQIEHLVHAVRWMTRAGVGAVEPRAAAQAAWVAEVDRRLEGTVWNAGGCRSWYLDATGRNPTIWPDSTWRFRRRVARFDPRDYVATPAPAAAATAPP